MAHIEYVRWGSFKCNNLGRAVQDPSFISSENLTVTIYPVDARCELTGAPGYIRAFVHRDVTAEKPDLFLYQLLLASSSCNNAYADGDDSQWSTIKVSFDRQDPDGVSGQLIDTETWELKRGLVVLAPACNLHREALELRFYEAMWVSAEGDTRSFLYHPELIDQED